MTEPYLCSVRDASQLSGVPVRTINRWVDSGRIVDHADGPAEPNVVDLAEVQELESLRLSSGGQLPKRPNVA